MLCDWATPTTIGSKASARDDLMKIHQKLRCSKVIYVIYLKALKMKIIKRLEIKDVQISPHS
jgi:hypothetical protein